MNKPLKIIVCIVMVSALALIIFCTQNYLSLGKELGAFRQQLAESRERWKTIAAEKEFLQEELKDLQNKLNIANLELNKSSSDAEEIKTEIEQLRTEIEELKGNHSND